MGPLISHTHDAAHATGAVIRVYSTTGEMEGVLCSCHHPLPRRKLCKGWRQSRRAHRYYTLLQKDEKLTSRKRRRACGTFEPRCCSFQREKVVSRKDKMGRERCSTGTHLDGHVSLTRFPGAAVTSGSGRYSCQIVRTGGKSSPFYIDTLVMSCCCGE